MRADTWVGEKCIRKWRKSFLIQKAFSRNLKKKKKGENQRERHFKCVGRYFSYIKKNLTLLSFVIPSFSPPLSFWLLLS